MLSIGKDHNEPYSIPQPIRRKHQKSRVPDNCRRRENFWPRHLLLRCLVLLRISVGLIFSLLAINPLHAETFGTQEEIFQAAKDGKEPAYIRELMQALSKKLAIVAKHRGESDHTKDLAWLFTMRNVVILDNVAYNAANHAAGRWAQDAVLDFSSNTAWCEAWNAAIGATSNPIPHSSVGEAADKAAKFVVEAAYSEAYKRAYKAAGEAIEHTTTIQE